MNRYLLCWWIVNLSKIAWIEFEHWWRWIPKTGRNPPPKVKQSGVNCNWFEWKSIQIEWHQPICSTNQPQSQHADDFMWTKFARQIRAETFSFVAVWNESWKKNGKFWGTVQIWWAVRLCLCVHVKILCVSDGLVVVVVVWKFKFIVFIFQRLIFNSIGCFFFRFHIDFLFVCLFILFTYVS